MWSFGDSELGGYPLKGSYQVGVKHFLTNKFKNEILVYYPIDKNVFESMKHEKDKKVYLVDRDHDKYYDNIQGLARVAQIGQAQIFDTPVAIVSSWKHIELEVIKNAPLADDFVKHSVPLLPMIFSHGLSGTNKAYSLQIRDYASHGHIIFAINHQDGSSAYTFDQNGDKLIFDSRPKIHELETRQKQLKIRENEALELIQEICENISQIKDKLGFNQDVQIATDHLSISGHSFGGITAVKAASLDKRIKTVIAYDPWFFPCQQEVLNNKIQLDCAVQIVMTEKFIDFCHEGKFDIWDLTKKVIDSSPSKQKECILLKTAYHTDQCDAIWRVPFDIQLFEFRAKYQYDRKDVYYTSNQIGLHFMAKIHENSQQTYSGKNSQKVQTKILRYQREDIERNIGNKMEKYIKYYHEFQNFKQKNSLFK
eukprot:403364144